MERLQKSLRSPDLPFLVVSSRRRRSIGFLRHGSARKMPTTRTRCLISSLTRSRWVGRIFAQCQRKEVGEDRSLRPPEVRSLGNDFTSWSRPRPRRRDGGNVDLRDDGGNTAI